MASYSAAHYFLEGLVDLGVDYIFANLGTDHVSIIEEMARWDKEGRKHPEVILCPHEVVAVHMAGGYALATGKCQAVLVHVDAGTANACMAIQNLFRYRLPVMLFAGRAPHTLHGELTGSRDTYVHFVQDPFDIASIVRPYVKWEYSLPSGVVVKEALARASAFAHSDPPGPVYMMLPRETLAEEWDEAAMPSYPPARYGSVRAGGIEPARAEAIAAATDGGGKSGGVRRLSRPQAERGRSHSTGWRAPAASGSPSSTRSTSTSRRTRPAMPAAIRSPLLENADLGLLLDTDVPFVPQSKRAREMKWIQIDIDPLKADFPMWGFATDMRVQGDSGIILQQVLDAVEARADDAFRKRVAARIESWNGAREASAKRRADCEQQQGRLRCAQYGLRVRRRSSDKISQDDVVLNEAIRNGPILQEHLKRTKPQSYVGLGRRRARLFRRHGAGPEAGAAEAPRRAGDRRRRLSLLLARQRLCGRAAIPDPDFHGRARQWRLAGGEIGDAARLPEGYRRRDRPVPVAPDVGTPGRAAGFLGSGKGLRRPRRMRARAGRTGRGNRPLPCRAR